MKKKIKLEDCKPEVQKIFTKIRELADFLTPKGYEIDNIEITHKKIIKKGDKNE